MYTIRNNSPKPISGAIFLFISSLCCIDILLPVGHTYAEYTWPVENISQNDPHRLSSNQPISSSSTQTPESFLDDPNNANPSTTSTNSQSRDELCREQCFQIVTKASKLMAEHQAYKDKEMILVRRKNPNFGRILGIQNRSLSNLNSDQQIIVSRLRVTRTTNNDHPTDDVEAKLKFFRTKRDKKQKDACKTLWDVQTCLSDASRECIGSLAFHTNEVITTQWLDRLRCPTKDRPDLKPFRNLGRSWIDYDEKEEVKHPVARPSTAKEDGRRRLEMMFGSGAVLLAPKFNPSSNLAKLRNNTSSFHGRTTTTYSPTSFIVIGIIMISLMLFVILKILFIITSPIEDDISDEKH